MHSERLLKVDFRQSLICLFTSAMVIFLLPASTYGSGLIKGRVEKKESYFRIGRPAQSEHTLGAVSTQNLGNLSNSPCFKVNPQKDLCNISASDFMLSGAVSGKTDDKVEKPSAVPALAADVSESDLLVVWEEWHKRISQTIYGQWATVAPAAGEAHVALTFRRDRSVTITVKQYHSLHGYSNDNESKFVDAIYKVVQSVSGSNELAFPEQSKRQEVVLNACFRSNPYDIASGYSYKHGDVERVNMR